MSPPEPPAGSEDLRTLKLAFLEALEQGESPAPWFAAYPEHAAILADLAVAAALPDKPPPAAEVAATEAIMRRTLRAHLDQTDRAEPGLAARVARQRLTWPAIAAQVRLPTEILIKIDRRVIPVDTVPARLLHQLAALLDCTAEALRAGLTGAGPQTAGAMYHATRPPTVRQQAFAAAVQASLNISAADRAYWLSDAEAPSGDPAPPDQPPL